MDTPFNRPPWAPARINVGPKGGTTCHFQRCAPITGDALYIGRKGEGGGGEATHGLVPNPEAVEFQTRYLARERS